MSLAALTHEIATPDQITYSTPAHVEDSDAMPLLQVSNKRQTSCDLTAQKPDPVPRSPQAICPHDRSLILLDIGDDELILLAQIRGVGQSFGVPTKDVTNQLHPSIPDRSPQLSNAFDETNSNESDMYHKIDSGFESRTSSEMDHFPRRQEEQFDYLEYFALKHHRRNEKKMAEGITSPDKGPTSLFDATEELDGEAESPTKDRVPVEETERAAWAHKQAGNLAEASAVYLRVIDRYTRKYGSRSALTLKALSNLAEIYQDQGLLPLSIEAYQKVVDGYKTIYGTSALETMQAVHNLAKAVEENTEEPDLQKAESLYRSAIAGFEALGGEGLAPRLNSQQFLGDLLCDAERYKEAKPLLLAAVCGYSALGLAHLEIVALGSLLELYNVVKDGRNLTRAISKMRILLEERIDSDHGRFPEILIEGIHLAGVYSAALEYEEAESLLSRIVPKLELLSDAMFGIEKVYGYIEYGTLHQMKRQWGEASNYLRLAREGLYKLNRHSDPVIRHVQARLVENEIYSGGSYDAPILSEYSLEQGAAVLGRNHIGASEADTGSRGTKSAREEAWETSTSSCKIGVTFSDSDIGDISQAQYYCP
jgi:tetratricopeptide (TPR) repeat protein